MGSSVLLDREGQAMDVKEAAKKAAAYTADMETLTKPDEKALFLSGSGFAIVSTRFDDSHNCWEIGVGFVREIDRRSNANGMVFGNQEPLRDLRTYKTVTISDDSGEVVSYE